MRYRYFAVTGKRFEDLEPGLRDSQIFALRYCHDDELEAMVKRAVEEKIGSAKIRSAITQWKPDNERV
jgi:hypothetical protein